MSNGNYLHFTEETQPQSGNSTSPRIVECRKLVASRYLDEGYINQGELDSDTGCISDTVDPYYRHSEYFWTLNDQNEVEATIRVINFPHGVKDEWQYPMQRDFEIEPAYQDYIDHYSSTQPEAVVEVSGLAERKFADELASLDMYRRFWQHAKRSNYSICLISADERLDKKLTALFGSGVRQVGESRFVMGSNTVPSILFPDKCVEAMSDIYADKIDKEGQHAAEEYLGLFKYLIDGLEAEYFSTEELLHMHRMGLYIDE